MKRFSSRGKIPDLLFHVAKAYFDFAVRYRKCYLLMLALFYSGRENEGFKTVYPLIQDYYNRIVCIFDEASGQLGNMNGETAAVCCRVHRDHGSLSDDAPTGIRGRRDDGDYRRTDPKHRSSVYVWYLFLEQKIKRRKKG